MSDVNTVMMAGRLTRNPETRQTPSGIAVCDFTIACNRYSNGKQYTTFSRCTAWNKTAEVIGDPEKGLHTGDHVFVQGRLVEDNFETTKGDPSTLTSGRMKVDNCNVTILRRKNPLPAVDTEPAAEIALDVGEETPEV